MKIRQNISLSTLTTMRLGGAATEVVEVTSLDEVRAAVRRAKSQQQKWYVLGGGSNTLAHDEGFDGLLILNKIPDFEIIEQSTDKTKIRVGAGELWDEVVARTVEMNLSNLECLSAIPGTAGAAPVQNIGAYGQEIGTSVVFVDAYDTKNDNFVQLSREECEFAYRHSIFRGREAGRYIITGVTLSLSATAPQPPFYKAVAQYLDAHNISTPSVRDLRRAVVAIRADKLPDPTIKPNTGSFFKNAIVSDQTFNEILAHHADVPHYPMPENQQKIPTGWLIEQAGLKGTLHHGMRVHTKNALVLINESATSYHDLAQARQEIIDSVRSKFGITIEQEPLELSS